MSSSSSIIPISTSDPAPGPGKSSALQLVLHLLLNAFLPTLCALLAIRSFIPPHTASNKAQSRCRQDAFAKLGLTKFPPILVSVLYTFALVWHLRVACGDVLVRFGGEWGAWAALPPLEDKAARTWEWVGWTMAGLGGALRFWCYRTLRHFFTFTLAVLDDHRIVSTGPYAIVRHPSYTGLFMVTSGLTLLMQCLPVPLVGNCPAARAAWVYAFCAFMIWSRISDEEDMMVREFEARRRARAIIAKASSARYRRGHGRQASIDSIASSSTAVSDGEPAAGAALGDGALASIGGPKAVLSKLKLKDVDLANYGSMAGVDKVIADARSGDSVEAIKAAQHLPAGLASVSEEEQSIGQAADEDYEEYRRKVPYKLLPYII
ncbi:hypothetical protein OC834_000475 [Tilletia horrida]|uniref:Protein-S-isoprenylcysteine O-methyltransferase n=1 Tax=Tilletia horrida TaxID=155126 RepID=A0AAN6JLU6_9BASI|nr:hypothetical protein OC835_004644 [Tilletia horrida]KAK0537539.1 hypothetical protein OC842_001592 [Tilletia horrida]KAK0538327.1 hypothetical protein OC834_000475 [Tilletia horrida]KAK0560497.1 hypothetical protein OC844_003723 [Tilletia horrida]